MREERYKILQIPKHETIKTALYEEVLYQMRFNFNSGVVVSNRGGWQSEAKYDDQSLPILSLRETIDTEVLELVDWLQPKSDMQYQISFQHWVNVNYRNQYNIDHEHVIGGTALPVLSGSYYLNKPKDSGRLILRSEKDYLKYHFDRNFDTEIDPKDGECVIFDPSIVHYVEPNKSDLPRISIAFNYAIIPLG